jgi:Uma2 family endonuclease
VKDLLLVAEVLSPSSVRYDRFTKRRLYQEQGVPLYWIVNSDETAVELWTPGDRFPVVERERLVWQPVDAGEPFMLPLVELYRPI